MIRIYLKHMFSFKRTFIIYSMLLLYPFNVFLRSVDNINDSNKLLYLMHDNVFSVYTATFLLIPLFLFLIEHNAILFSNNNVIVKMRTKENWWKERIKLLFIDIIIFTIFTNVLVYLPLFAMKKLSFIHLTLLINALRISLLQFLGYAVLGMLFAVAKLLTGKRYMGFIVPMAIGVLDYIFMQCGVNIAILTNHMFIPVSAGQAYVSIWLFRSSIYLIILFVIVFLIGWRLIKEKDLLEDVYYK